MAKQSKASTATEAIPEAIKKPVEKKVLPVRNKNKVAIVGYAPSSRMLAPFNDPDFEIWGVNELYKIVPRVDVLFELHHRKWFNSKARNPQHEKWLKSTKIPIFTLEEYPDIPTSVRFPIEAIKGFLKPYNNYFTNSVSYMIALAIFLQFDEIHIFGIDMATEEEYQQQRPSVEYFCGIAQGVYMTTGKCKMYIPPECDLLKTMFQYGYDDDQMTAAKKKIDARKRELQGRLNQHVNEERIARDKQMIMRGAMDNTVYFERCLMGTIGIGEEIECCKT